MDKIKPTPLPAGTILTTEGKDKILTGKLQRRVVAALYEMRHTPFSERTVAALVKELRDVAPQNVHRTLKALEEKGVIRMVKQGKGGALILCELDSRMTGEKTADGWDVWEYYISHSLLAELHHIRSELKDTPEVVGNHDFVAAIEAAWTDRQSEVFKTAKPAREGDTRWYFVTFNKPDLYKLAASKYLCRIGDDGCSMPYALVEQAARGAWQPFFDTLKKNKVIAYHDTKEGHLMVWDNRRWAVYKTRVMKERQEIIDSWEV